jgi:hypothetical protein
MSEKDTDFIADASKKFKAAKTYWEPARQDYEDDARFICGDPTKQWPDDIYNWRASQDLPTLTYDRCNPRVQAIVNKSRSDRPRPRILPSDNAKPEAAEALEGKIRHVIYASQADIPFDHAVVGASGGGFGLYRLVMEYNGERGFIQEPRIKRILDPLTAFYPDPASVEPNFSDAKYWFILERFTRENFKAKFGEDPKPFDHESDFGWGDDEDHVWCAEYWKVDTTEKRYLQMTDGREGFVDELEFREGDEVATERMIEDRKVTQYLIDGEKIIEQTVFPCKYIPIFVVTGQQFVYKNKRRFKSAIRYVRDPQSMLNASTSEVAVSLGTANLNGWVGPAGSFKDPKWRSGKREIYREYNPVVKDGQILPPPQRDNWTPPIQHLTAAVTMSAEALQASMGYVDRLVRPSQTDLSGIAVDKREEQADAANVQFEDNLIASQWHLGICLVDILRRTTDTPRTWMTMGEDKSQKRVNITTPDQDGYLGLVEGQEQKPHVRIDEGDFDVIVESGPSYDTKNEEETAFMGGVLNALGPQYAVNFMDLLFQRKGFKDLQERAEMLLPPAIQQSMHSQEGDLPPHVMRAQLASAGAQNQQLQQLLQQLSQIIKTKSIENQGRLQTETVKQQGETSRDRLKLAGELIKQLGDNAHDHHKEMQSDRMEAIQHLIEILNLEMQATPQEQMQMQAAAQPTGGNS